MWRQLGSEGLMNFSCILYNCRALQGSHILLKFAAIMMVLSLRLDAIIHLVISIVINLPKKEIMGDMIEGLIRITAKGFELGLVIIHMTETNIVCISRHNPGGWPITRIDHGE